MYSCEFVHIDLMIDLHPVVYSLTLLTYLPFVNRARNEAVVSGANNDPNKQSATATRTNATNVTAKSSKEVPLHMYIDLHVGCIYAAGEGYSRQKRASFVLHAFTAAKITGLSLGSVAV